MNHLNQKTWGADGCLHFLLDLHRECAKTIAAIDRLDLKKPLVWAHHAPRVRKAIAKFCDKLKFEIARFGEWRPDELQPDEVIELINEEGYQLCSWVSRITGIALPRIEALE
jgi:hypothetical protein